MPELPEVETIKNYLERKIINSKILKIEVLNKKQFIGKLKTLINKKIKSIERKGKILIFKINNNFLLAHLKLTGQLIFSQNLEKLKTTGVVFHLNNGYLIFNDVRKFGWLKIVKDLNKEINNLGIEPFSKNFNLNYLKEIFSKSNQPIKLVLMDQRKIAGLSNIYANEALFLAKINPLEKVNSLTDNEIKRLKNSILKVLKNGIKYEGSSFRFYLKPDKSRGRYQEKFLIYQREKCYNCYSKIKRVKLNNRSTFYCPKCQK